MAERLTTDMGAKTMGSEGVPQRKPYAAPTLRRLGSVRDLTLGSTAGCAHESGKASHAKSSM